MFVSASAGLGWVGLVWVAKRGRERERVAYDEEMKMELGDYGVFVIVLRTCRSHERG